MIIEQPHMSWPGCDLCHKDRTVVKFRAWQQNVSICRECAQEIVTRIDTAGEQIKGLELR